MYRLIMFLFIISYMVSCTPKLATQADSEDYIEDVSAFRPSAGEDKTEITDSSVTPSKGPYVAPTNTVNGEMNIIMDSIIVHNRDKTYITYTIRVFIGRSREEANQVREKVYRVLPDEKPQLSYKQPSYKVNVGKYIDRVEAYKTLTKLRSTFPGATLVREQNYME